MLYKNILITFLALGVLSFYIFSLKNPASSPLSLLSQAGTGKVSGKKPCTTNTKCPKCKNSCTVCLTEEEARKQLEEAGIGVNKPAPQTKLDGIPQCAIDAMKDIANKSDGDPVVTGGTEDGHKTHGSGCPTFDLRKGEDEKLDNYIKEKGKICRKTAQGDNVYRVGDLFCTEENSASSPHWHCAMTCAVSNKGSCPDTPKGGRPSIEKKSFFNPFTWFK